MRLTRLLAGVVFGGIVVSGCQCKPETGDRQFGEIGVVYQVGEMEMIGKDGTYDFGKVPMGTSQPIRAVIRNLGRGALDLESVEKESGANLKLGETLNEAPPIFDLAFIPTS